jgi:hypothetical protein
MNVPDAGREAVGGAHEVEPLRLGQVLRRQRRARPPRRRRSAARDHARAASASSGSLPGQRVVQLPQLPAALARHHPASSGVGVVVPTGLNGLARLDGAVVVALRPHQRSAAMRSHDR